MSKTLLADLENIIDEKKVTIATFVKRTKDDIIYCVMRHVHPDTTFSIEFFTYIEDVKEPISYNGLKSGSTSDIAHWDKAKKNLENLGFKSYDQYVMNMSDYYIKNETSYDEAEEIHSRLANISSYVKNLGNAANTLLQKLGVIAAIIEHIPDGSWFSLSVEEIFNRLNFNNNERVSSLVSESIKNPFIFITSKCLSDAAKILEELRDMPIRRGSLCVNKIANLIERIYDIIPIIKDNSYFGNIDLNDFRRNSYKYSENTLENKRDEFVHSLDYDLDIAEDYRDDRRKYAMKDYYGGDLIGINEAEELIDSIRSRGYYSEGNVVITEASDEIREKVLQKMGKDGSKIVNIYGVQNLDTEKAFQSNKNAAKGDHRKFMILFHGSRTERWNNIIENGMILEKAKNGMFGKGLYFADDADKARGYTSVKGSRWAKGDEETGFLALYKVRTGKKYELARGDSNAKNLMLKAGCDSVKGVAGQDLLKNEYVIYDEAQCTIYAIIEIK